MAESRVLVRAKIDACDIPRSRRVLPVYVGTTPAVTESPRRRASKALEVLQLLMVYLRQCLIRSLSVEISWL